MQYKITHYFPYIIFIPFYIFIGYILIHIYNNIENLRLQYTLFFGLGIFFQTLLILPAFEGKDYLKILGNIGFSLLGFLRGKNEDEYDLFFHILLVYVIFIFLYVVSFAEKIIQVISEVTVYMLTLSMWYIILFKLYDPYGMWNELVIWMPILVLTVMSYIVGRSIYSDENTERQEIILYVSFILMLVFLSIIQISLGHLDVFFTENFSAEKSFFNIFVTGIMFSYCLGHIAYIIQLLPIAFGKRDTQKDIDERVKRFKGILVKNFTQEQLSNKFACIIFVVMSLFFSIDYFFLKLSSSIIVEISFIMVLLLQALNNYLSKNNMSLSNILNNFKIN